MKSSTFPNESTDVQKDLFILMMLKNDPVDKNHFCSCKCLEYIQTVGLFYKDCRELCDLPKFAIHLLRLNDDLNLKQLHC